MKLAALPFHIGPTEQPSNPGGLPLTFPFEVVFDDRHGVLTQPTTDALQHLLQSAYELGQAFGTPLADDSFGQPYAADFLSFMEQTGAHIGAGLEIGAGVGYLTRRLMDLGWAMTSLEPGKGYEPWWSHYRVEVLREFFPSPRAPGPFDMICCYGVLEHIADPSAFLRAVREHLRDGGWAFFAVPDCTDEIRAGDPSILFHEHFSYFDAGSLARLLSGAGLTAKVARSGFGRCLYAAARADAAPVAVVGEPGLARDLVASYPQRCHSYTMGLRDQLHRLAVSGSLGVYCAGRGLAILDPALPLRFFDDDPAQHGKYLPPFNCPIESRVELLARPVDSLVILSRTFGAAIRKRLLEYGYSASILTIDDLLGSAPTDRSIDSPMTR